MNTCVFEAYSGFTNELQQAIRKAGTGVGVILLHGFAIKITIFL
jgi:hypothetical protein